MAALIKLFQMQIDVSFDFAKVYNIDNIDVVKGQKFSFQADGEGRWFSDNDEVISYKVTGKEAQVSADTVGLTTILIMDDTLTTIKTLTVNVIDEIVQKAVTLGATSGTPVLK